MLVDRDFEGLEGKWRIIEQGAPKQPSTFYVQQRIWFIWFYVKESYHQVTFNKTFHSYESAIEYIKQVGKPAPKYSTKIIPVN